MRLLEAPSGKRAEEGEIDGGQGQPISPAPVGVDEVVVAFPSRGGDHLDLPGIEAAGLIDRPDSRARRIGIRQVDAGGAGLKERRKGVVRAVELRERLER